MALTLINIENLRNISQATLKPSPSVNLFIGANGSGKTSILEAIYLLAYGKSFRQHLHNRLIKHHQDALTVFATKELPNGTSLNIGISKHCDGETTLRVNQESIPSASLLAETLPLLIISPDTNHIFDSGPKIRRQLIDWGAFQMDMNFFTAWRRNQQALKQRNALLRNGCNRASLAAWDDVFVTTALQLDTFRQRHVELITPMVLEIASKLLGISTLELEYYRGWKKGSDLLNLLFDSFEGDLAVGYTKQGAHRADLRVKINNTPAVEILSRGQQKLLVYAFKLAQGQYLKRFCQKNCIFLVDDMTAELDHEKRDLVAQMLIALDTQLFLTAVDERGLERLKASSACKMFHVEQGKTLPAM